MQISKLIVDKSRRGVTNRLLLLSLVISIPAFFFTERHLRTLFPFRTVVLPFPPANVHFAPDNSAIVVHSQVRYTKADGWVAVYEFPSLKERWRVKSPESYKVRFSLDGQRVIMDNYAVTTTWDAQTGIRIKSDPSRFRTLSWSVETGTVGKRYELHEQGKGTKKSWYLHDRQQGSRVLLGMLGKDTWRPGIFTPDEKYLIIVNRTDRAIRCWRTADAKQVAIPKIWRELGAVALYPTPDNKLIAVCCDSTIKEFPFSVEQQESGVSVPIKTLAKFPAEYFCFGILSDSGRFLYTKSIRFYLDNTRVAGPEVEKILFDRSSHHQEEIVEQIIDRHTGKVRTFAVWEGGIEYAMIDKTGWAYTYDTQARFMGVTTKNRPFLFAAKETLGLTPRIQDLRNGEEWFVPRNFTSYTARASNDGRMVATINGQRLDFWKLPERK